MDRQVSLTALEMQASSAVIASLILVRLVKTLHALFWAPACTRVLSTIPAPWCHHQARPVLHIAGDETLL